MKNSDLINLLKQLDPDKEIGVEIHDTHTGQFIDSTYAIAYFVDEYGALVLKIDTDK